MWRFDRFNPQIPPVPPVGYVGYKTNEFFFSLVFHIKFCKLIITHFTDIRYVFLIISCHFFAKLSIYNKLNRFC